MKNKLTPPTPQGGLENPLQFKSPSGDLGVITTKVNKLNI